MAKAKLKTHKGMAKRIKITGSGKLKYKKCGTRHLLATKGKAQRRYRYGKLVHESDVKKIKNLLPYAA